jgi:beta-glucosidase
MKSIPIVFLFVVIFPLGILFSQDEVMVTGEYLYRQYEKDGSVLPYRIMYPYDFSESGKYPLVLFLHGAGERGDDNEKQLIHGSRLFRDSLEKYPAIVVFPQCPEGDFWANLYRPDKTGPQRKFDFFYDSDPNPSMEGVISLVGELLEEPFIDHDRFYVAGLSMGGMGTFELTWRMQDRVAAAIPICGGGPVEKAGEMTKVPYWVIHGMKDKVVNPVYSANMVKAIQEAGGRAKITLYWDAGHNSWDPAFAEPDFLQWLFSKKRESAGSDVYRPYLSPEVETLFREMTLEEKIGQLNLLTPGGTVTGEVVSKDVEKKIKSGSVGGIFGIRGAARAREAQRIAVEESRLGIPILIGMDVIHGHKTIFPLPLALSCTWDMELIGKTARVAAREASADGLMWAFSPMVDVARDPRWGRVAEGAGEDPFLGSAVAKAMVRGYQGDDLKDPTTIMACVKHYANYGAPEGGREYATVDMSKIVSYNEYLPPYKAAIDAGAGSVMTSFNVLDLVPATANREYLHDILRKQWGFDGFIITDYTTVLEMELHGLGDLETVSVKALEAGIDMDMVGESFVKTLKGAVEKGILREDYIDLACRRILEAKEKLGLFDDPFRYFDEEREKTEILSPENRAFAREVGPETFVLLKNENEILPLDKNSTIALVGPLADSRRNMLGTWSVSGDHNKAVTVIEGMRNVMGGKGELLYAKGANISDDPEFAKKVNVFGQEIVIDERSPEEMIREAVRIAKKADVVVAVMGEAADMSGECASMADIGLQPGQKKLLEALVETGKPIVMVLYNGRPMTLVWENENLDAILDVWFGGTEGGHAVADVLFGDAVPNGRLTTSFPVSVGQIPVYHSMLPTGRPDYPNWSKFRSNYIDIPNDPLFPFGYGLSYTTFEYGEAVLDNRYLSREGSINLSVEVRNTGNRKASEVVQLYIGDPVASISRPVKTLKGFHKIQLEPGESESVVFTIDRSLLGFYDSEGNYLIEPGLFRAMIGPNSADLQILEFELK